MERHEVNALFRLLADYADEQRRIHVGDVALETADCLVNRHGAERLGTRIKHPLANRLDVLADGKVHHEVSSGLEGDCELLKFVALPGVRHATPEVRVYLGSHHAPDAHGTAIRVVVVQRDHGGAVRHGGADNLYVNALVRRDRLHRVRHNAFAG